MITVHQIELPAPGLTQLQTDGRDGGYDFVEAWSSPGKTASIGLPLALSSSQPVSDRAADS